MEQLEQKDLKEAGLLAKILSQHFKGKSRAVKTPELLQFLKKFDLNISGQTLRRLLGYIRQNDLMQPYFVLSNVNMGYWCTDDLNEMKAFVDQEMHRMSNQFSNIEKLRSRIINSKPTKQVEQLHFFI